MKNLKNKNLTNTINNNGYSHFRYLLDYKPNDRYFMLVYGI